MKTSDPIVFVTRGLYALVLSALLLVLSAHGIRAQSTRQEYPTAIRSSQISGEIAPLDIGDARSTRYYYAFYGTPGDLTLTVISSGLNGDVDIFAATGMRPVMKVSLVSSATASSATKTVFLHQRELMILRVEARTLGDDPGTFTISFVGSFEPITGEWAGDEAPEAGTKTATNTKGGRRVSSVGATIPEPPKPVEAQAEASPTPEETPSPATSETMPPPDTTGSTATEVPKAEQPTATAPRTTPGRRRTPTRRGTTGRNTRTGPGTGTTASNPPANSQEPPAQTNARLIIELKDGTLIDRPMSTIRRVLVDNAQIVVINNNGKIDRMPLSNVNRMSVQPE